jgi:uncharacterized membrane protein
MLFGHFVHGPWPLFGLLWFVFLAFFVGNLVRRIAFRNRRHFAWQGDGHHGWHAGGPVAPPTQLSALEILSQRYARGEIDGTTFDQMRERLENATRPRQ